MKVHDELYIGGKWVRPEGSDTIELVSPYTEEAFARVAVASPADVDRAVDVARVTFDTGEWRRASVEDRIGVVARLAEIYAPRIPEMAALVTSEMGAPITTSQMTQGGAWMLMNSLVEVARHYDWEETRPGVLGAPILVRSEPIGVVGAIVPWNAPQFVTLSKLVPALIAGCSIVLKPAPETPLDAYLLAEIAKEAGVPDGVLSVLPADRTVSEHLVTHPGVDKISFTGSTEVGKRIAGLCGEQLKRVSLELGGKSAAIVLDDADLAATVAGLRFSSYGNSGQQCVAQTRVLASRRRYDEVVDALAAMVEDLKIGDPDDAATEIGPLVSRRQQERVEKYIALGQEEGARVATGGSGRPSGQERGWYVQPTLFAGVDNTMRIAQEEIFGPVVVVIPYDDDADAVRIANDSPYGLAGSVWSADTDRALQIACQVQAGNLAINQFSMDFTAPFGGYKDSGIGREYGKEGFDEYVQLKSIVLPKGAS